MDVNKELQAVACASQDLVLMDDATINKILYALADRIDRCTDEILSANAIDLQAMDPADPKYDRLKLTEERLNGIASDIRNVAMLPSPLNRVMEEFYAHRPSAAGEKLKELLGHTPLEVFMGAIVGIVVSYVIHFYILQ